MRYFTLAEAQQVTLVHGGATVNASPLSRTDFSFQAKHDRNLAAKPILNGEQS